METGAQRSYSPYGVPSCPHRMCGYPIPIYKARRPIPGLVVRTYRVQPDAHVEGPRGDALLSQAALRQADAVLAAIARQEIGEDPQVL